MPMTQPMPMTQLTTTTQPMTTMPVKTKTTANTMPNDPARSTTFAPTLCKPQQLPQPTTNVMDDTEDNFPAMIMMMMLPMTISMAYNKTTENTKSVANPATTPTPSTPQIWMQSTADTKDDTKDYFRMMLPTTMPMKPTTTNTKTTKKMMIGNLSTVCTPQLLMQFTADVLDDLKDKFLMMIPTMMLSTRMLTTTYTGTTKKMTIALHKPQPPMQFTGDAADNVTEDFPMPPPTILMTMLPMTVNIERNPKMMICPPDQSTTTAYTFCNSPPLVQPTTEITNDAKDDFGPMIPTMPPLHTSTTSLTPLPDYHISNSTTAMTNPTIYHSNTTIQWVRDTFAPVFKALECLEVAIAKLSNNLQAATGNLCPIDLPIPPTPNPQPHHIQLQFPCTSSCKQHPRETPSGNAPNLHNRTQPQTLQQTLYTQQTHHCHHNHTKHRDFLCPSLPIFQPQLIKRLPLPVHV